MILVRFLALAVALTHTAACHCTEIGWGPQPGLYIYFYGSEALPADHYEVLVEYTDFLASCEVDLPFAPDSEAPWCGSGGMFDSLTLSAEGTTLDRLTLGRGERRVTVTVRGASGVYERTEVLHTTQHGGSSPFECNSMPGYRTASMEL